MIRFNNIFEPLLEGACASKLLYHHRLDQNVTPKTHGMCFHLVDLPETAKVPRFAIDKITIQPRPPNHILDLDSSCDNVWLCSKYTPKDSTESIMGSAVTSIDEETFKNLAKESYRNAKLRGRNTIRYEDIAEARTKKSSLSFLETLLP